MSNDSNKITPIRRREAKSGNVSYGDPIVLHDTSKSRILMIPFFIPRTEGTDLSIKIESFKKLKKDNLEVKSKDKFISLNERASRKLLTSLRDHLSVAKEDDGNYLVVRISEGTAQIGEHDPGQVASALTKVLGQKEIVEHLKESELSDELIEAFLGAIRFKEMVSAVSELKNNLNLGQVKESVYQAWCEKHSWAFGNAYVVRDSVREISTGDSLDILLPNVISGYRDFVELKRPDKKVLVHDTGHKNYYFSSDVSQAIGQCHRYLDVLHEEAAKGLRDNPEVIAYHPRATIVIGRSDNWTQDQHKALRGLNTRLSGITVMTYDHLLAQSERVLEFMQPKETAVNPDTCSEFDDLIVFEDDEIQF